MHDAAGLLQDLAVALGVAALTTVVFQRLRLPVVLGYLLAGFIVGPHLPIPLFASLERVQTLSELGVIVLMFSLGLEFSIRRLLRLGPSAGLIATVEVGLMAWLGYLLAQQLGWGPRLSVFAGGMVAISSTMIVARSFAELRTERRITDLVYGVLIVEDVYAMLLIAVLTTVAAGAGLSAGDFAASAARLSVVFLLMVALGLLFVPRALSYVAGLGSRETTLVAAVGTCFGFAMVAHLFGYSVALGAFIAGLLAAESGEAPRIEHLVRPLRDVFGALFFVSIGMLVDPALLVEHWRAIVLFTAVVLVGKVVGVSLGALMVGHRTETAVRAGMSLAQIGEFSFLIAGVAATMGPAASFLPPVAVAVSVITAFLTPFLARRAERVGLFVDQRLPRRLRTYLSLYASWLERARERPRRVTLWTRVRRQVLWLALDAAFVVAVVVGAGFATPRLSRFLGEAAGLSPWVVDFAITLAELVAVLPFAIGIVRCVRRLGQLLAAELLPHTGSGLDLAAAPRRALVAGLQLTLLLFVALPVLALTQPFLPAAPSVGFLLVLLSLAFWGLWRSATNLEGHVRAGSAMIVEVLASQSREARPPTLDGVADLLPGLGKLTAVRVWASDGAVGRRLDEVNLHGRSGASILCVTRGSEGVIAPTGDLLFEAGDVLTLAGTAEAIEAARKALSRAPEPVEG